MSIDHSASIFFRNARYPFKLKSQVFLYFYSSFPFHVFELVVLSSSGTPIIYMTVVLCSADLSASPIPSALSSFSTSFWTISQACLQCPYQPVLLLPSSNWLSFVMFFLVFHIIPEIWWIFFISFVVGPPLLWFLVTLFWSLVAFFFFKRTEKNVFAAFCSLE